MRIVERIDEDSLPDALRQIVGKTIACVRIVDEDVGEKGFIFEREEYILPWQYLTLEVVFTDGSSVLFSQQDYEGYSGCLYVALDNIKDNK